jgi:hypothetical protein
MHRYRAEILAELARKGIHPKPGTDPGQARGLVNDLYRFEIRDLKLRLKETEGILGPQPMENYRRQVLELKAKYQRLLGLPAEAWVLPDEGAKDG